MLRRILRIVRGLALATLTPISVVAAAMWIDIKWNPWYWDLSCRQVMLRWGGVDGQRFGLGVRFDVPKNMPIFLVNLFDSNARATDAEWDWSLRDWIAPRRKAEPSWARSDTWDVWAGHYGNGSFFPQTESPTYDLACQITAPLSVTVTVSGAWPLLAGVSYVRHRRRARYRRTHGLCLKCGYNLTGLPNPRCPECGTGFDPKPGKVLT